MEYVNTSVHGRFGDVTSRTTCRIQSTNSLTDFAYIEPQEWSLYLHLKEFEALYIRGCDGIVSEKMPFLSSG